MIFSTQLFPGALDIVRLTLSQLKDDPAAIEDNPDVAAELFHLVGAASVPNGWGSKTSCGWSGTSAHVDIAECV